MASLIVFVLVFCSFFVTAATAGSAFAIVFDVVQLLIINGDVVEQPLMDDEFDDDEFVSSTSGPGFGVGTLVVDDIGRNGDFVMTLSNNAFSSMELAGDGEISFGNSDGSKCK
jgi:hypothetical protein